ncbi:glycosyltransferase family 87 protein [Propionibacterium sp.]|uniref:glycosyltransferase family 87 protein n=1 Tax=Propionibacterium sp. TaxID=1977903 RepID=UPI0039E8D4C8
MQQFTERIGGPLGRHAGPWGVWFNPVPWALALSALNWIVLMARQAPCQQHTYGQPVNPFLRLCYSDVPLIYQGHGISLGAAVYGQAQLEYPVLIGYVVMLGRYFTRLFGGVVGPQASGQQQLDASQLFFVLTSIGLFCCFLALVIAHLLMGRDSAGAATGGVRTRSFDALFIAAAPVVAATGLINWDMLAVALTSLGVLLWARRRPALAGVLIGLAFSAKFYPILVVAALLLLCIRAGKMREAVRFMSALVVVWVAVNLPVIMTAPAGWARFWTMNFQRNADLGSLWYVLSLMGLSVPGLNVIVAVFMIAGLVVVAWLVFNAPLRPRLGQVVFLLLVVFLVCNKVYSPQYSLWLLPFLVLARPKVVDWAVWNVAELMYFFAVWGLLEGILGVGESANVLYWVAVLLRIAVQLWVASRVVRDILKPWDDPVRVPYTDDPVGGVLDHATDAPWVIRAHAVPDA